jgi:putative beta-lysine N-acetyltransferase
MTASSESGPRASSAHVPDLEPPARVERVIPGVVELRLTEQQSVKLVGVVYGLEHAIHGDGYEATIFLDHYNRRIRVLSYEATNFEALVLRLRWLAEANGLDKIVCMATALDWLEFLRFGYVLEAVIKHFHRGEDAFVVSKFRSQERLTSVSLMDEILLIERILAERPPWPQRPVPEGTTVRMASTGDIDVLVELYRSVFASYPSPLLHASYLRSVFDSDSLFAVAERKGQVIAAASAELHHHDRAAELTDCATRPDARGGGLMVHLLRRLEVELVARRYVCAYTMARARSFGMNRVFHRLGYAFMGRLVNNCDIYGAIEDMNIWVRRLETSDQDERATGPELGAAPEPRRRTARKSRGTKP